MAGLGDLCRKSNSLLLVDTVCSLGGVPMFADDWGIDAIYSGSQKCIGGPPGAAPLMFGERAMNKLKARTTKVASYYFDLNLVGAGGDYQHMQMMCNSHWPYGKPSHHINVVVVVVVGFSSGTIVAQETTGDGTTSAGTTTLAWCPRGMACARPMP